MQRNIWGCLITMAYMNYPIQNWACASSRSCLKYPLGSLKFMNNILQKLRNYFDFFALFYICHDFPPPPKFILFFFFKGKNVFHEVVLSVWAISQNTKLLFIDLTLCFYTDKPEPLLVEVVRAVLGYCRPDGRQTGYSLLGSGVTAQGFPLFLPSWHTWKMIIFTQHPVIIAHSCWKLAWGLWLPQSLPRQLHSVTLVGKLCCSWEMMLLYENQEDYYAMASIW